MRHEIEEKMQKTIEATRRHMATIRTGRANPDLLSRIHVDYYGSEVPLQQVASISVPEAMTLVLNVFDKGAVKAIEKAIQTSDLHLTPMTEGNLIRLRLPELTEDRRKDLVKLVKKHIEDSKVAVRNIRRDAVEDAKHQEKDKQLSTDESKHLQQDIQKLTDQYIEKLDHLAKEKEAEILKI